MPDQSRIRFRSTELEGNVVLVVTGEIDMSTADPFDDQIQALVTAAHSPAYVDLSGVSFIDSSGLNVLLRTSQTAEHAGVNLVLVKPSRQVRRTLVVAGLGRSFEIRE